MARLSRKQFLHARFNGEDDDDDDYETVSDYVAAVRRYYAEKAANLVSFALCSLVMTKSFSEVVEVFARVMP